MIHARPDYQARFHTDPALEHPELLPPGGTPIADDEPVMLFRAQDRLMVPVLEEYLRLLGTECYIGDSEIQRKVREHIARVLDWQLRNRTKIPDVPEPEDLVYWTPEQVASLNGFQQCGRFHPFTCPLEHVDGPRVERDLVASRDGWRCPVPGCAYRQYWAHATMLDGSWQQAIRQMPFSSGSATEFPFPGNAYQPGGLGIPPEPDPET